MNREDIIRMALDAGARAQQNKNCDVEYLFSVEQIERLLAAEREACAKVADRHSTCKNDTPDVIAVAIRARGQA